MDNQKVLLSLPKNNKYEVFLLYFIFSFNFAYLCCRAFRVFLWFFWCWLTFSRWCLIIFFSIQFNTHSFEKKKKRKKLFNNNSAIDSPAIDRQATSREKIKVILVCANTTVCDVAFRYSNL